MNVLFDHGTPVPLRNYLPGHSVETAFERGWQQLENGQLLSVAEREGYAVLVTTDQNLRYQQNLQGRKMAIVVLLSTSWPRIQHQTEAILKAVDQYLRGRTLKFQFPRRRIMVSKRNCIRVIFARAFRSLSN